MPLTNREFACEILKDPAVDRASKEIEKNKQALLKACSPSDVDLDSKEVLKHARKYHESFNHHARLVRDMVEGIVSGEREIV